MGIYRQAESMARLGPVTETLVKLETNIFCHSSTLKLEAADSSELLITLYQTAGRYINLHTQSRGNLTPNLIWVVHVARPSFSETLKV